MKKFKKTIALLNCIAIVLNSTSPVWAVIKEEKTSTSNIEISNLNGKDENKKSTITWTSSDSIEVGSIFDKMNGVKALDKEGKDITQLVSVEGEVNTEKAGTYTLKYTATSDKGEVINESRNITVIENKSQETINNETEDAEKDKGPKITGSDVIRTYLGEEFDPKFGVSAIDENGKDITELITVEGEVKTNELDSYELKYSVIDELGKTATFNRKVQVINKNIFNAYIEKINEETKEKVKELGFSIYLDNKTSKFVVENQSTDKLNPSIKDEIAFKIRVLDKDNNEKLVIDLLGEDTGDSEKLNALKELEYSYGDFIEIHPKDAKEGFNIEGPILGDIDISKEDYFDGVDNIDYINNVRFKIVEDGIESVYNNAPQISGLEVMDKLLTERDKQLEGVKVTDDHDGDISVDDIQVSEEKDEKDNVIGLRYTVSDSWGRNTSVIRLLKSDEVKLYSTGPSGNTETTLSQNIIEVHGINYPDNDTLRFKLNFNQDTKKIEVSETDGRLFDNKVKDKYFELIIYNKYGNVREKLTINGSDRSDTDKLSNFKGNFEFGDQIHLYHKYSDDKLKIKGSIVGLDKNAHENGIFSDKLIKNRFELDKTGLKYLTNEPPTITWREPDEIRKITRGEKVDLLDDITITDTIDGEIDRNRATVTEYNPNILGEQTVTYTVRDSWDAETTKERKIVIVSDTDLANTSIDVMKVDGSQNNESQSDESHETTNLEGDSQDTTQGNGEQGKPNDGAPSNEGQKAFSIKFDNFEKKILIVNKSGNKLNETKPNEVAFRIRVFSKAGITKKDISLNGNDTGLSEKLNELHDFKYTDGDTIELWSSDPKKGLKIVGNIVKDNEITEDYHDGIDNDNFMNNVRFELQANTLYAKYNNKPSIVFNNDLTIKRGEKFDPLIFINHVIDDHDTINKNLVRASYKKDEVYKVGKHNIEYKVSDKWGRSHLENKTITVLPKNKLEETKIKLFKETQEVSDEGNSTNKPILTLYFDDVEKKIVGDVVTDATISGAANTDVFKISVFDSSNQLKGESTIKANESLNSSSLSEVTGLTLEDNDNISITAYKRDKVSIDGEVVSNHKSSTVNNKYENGFDTDDKMNNTRFILTSDGLKELYNNAPDFNGAEDTSILKGQSFDKLEGVSVTDDHDGDIQISNSNVIGEINNQKLGPQTLTYEVSDSWGRTTQKTRIVTVKSKAANNEIELKNSLDQTAFKIGFDFVKNKFKVSEQSKSAINLSNKDYEFFIFIADRDDQYVDSVLLKGTDTGDSEKLNKLKNVAIRTGYKFFVWSKDHRKLSITGDITIDNEITKADYSAGIDKDDLMNNIVFKVTEDGLEAMYNQAPVINLRRTTSKHTLYKGDDYKKDLLARVVYVNDDHDGSFSEEKIQEKMKIKLTKKTNTESSLGNRSVESESAQPSEPESDTETEQTPGSEQTEFDLDNELDRNNITLGEYVATYEIKDSWGRTSEVKQVDVEVLTSIDRNEINFGGYRDGIGDVRVDLKLGFNSKVVDSNDNMTDGNSIKVKIMDLPDKMTRWFDITVYNENGETKVSKIRLNQNDNSEQIKTKLEQLLNANLQYGDYIMLDGEQKFRYSIDGPVRNGREDYTDGVQLGDDLLRTKFHIKKEGLSVTYEPLKIEDNESVIEYVGTNGRVPFRIKFNHDTKAITYMNTEGYYDFDKDGVDILKVKWNKKDTSNGNFTTKEFVYKGRNQGVGNSLKDFVGRTFNDGDYITFWTKTPTRVRVYGKLANNKDYEAGVPSEDILTNTRFTLRSTDSENKKYLDPIYNKAPEFSGVEDVNIYVGDTFDPHDRVTVTDDHDKDYDDHHSNNCDGHNTNSNSKTTSDDETGNEETGCDKHGNNTLCYQVNGSYNKDQVGKYPFTYTSTDSWGRKTTVTRNVYVRPQIFKNRIMLYAKEETTNEGEATTPESRDTTNQNDIAPAFEIGVDNETGKYTVTNQLDKPLNPNLDGDVTFRILIYDNDGTKKANVELNGADTGQSTKLEALNKVDYSREDYIRLWSAEPKYLRITGPITQDSSENGTDNSANGDNSGNVEGGINGKEDYNNGIDNEDKMKNVAFKLTNDEMSTIYNQAPEFKGLKPTMEILFGDEFNLLKDVTISDDKDTNLTTSNVTTIGEVNKDQIGSYTVTHTVTDSWGRSTIQEVTYKVVSKIKQNSIEVYGSSSNNSRNTTSPESNTNEKKFTLKFNTDTNKIDVNINNNSNAKTTSSEITEDSTTDGNGTPEEPKKDFKIVVRNIDTGIKASVSLNESEMMLDSSFNKLKEITLSNGDTISLDSKSKSNIKIKGHIEKLNNKNFSEQFPEDLEFKNVRFKVTNKGLELFEYENLDDITMNDLTITRGDDSNKYDGINFNFKNNDSYLGLKIDIQDFDKFKLGEQTAKYVFSDSWGQTKELTRKVTVTERNELEKNKIKVLNKDNRKQEILYFEFDTIEKKIIPKIAENQPNNYTKTVNDLLNIKLYDSEGVTKSNITVTPSNLSLIPDIEYDDGDLISISAYDNQNGLSITGKIDNQKENYEDGVNKSDNIENVRFEIKESGLKSVYNNAPILNLQNNLTLFKDESPDLYAGISVTDTDEHDNGKIADNTQIETDLDITKIGDYTATYTAIDNWGRKSESRVRTITVKSSLENNKIGYYPPNSPDNSAFDITIDNENNQLKVKKNYTTFRKIKKRNASQDSEIIFEVRLFSENGESKQNLTILSNDDTSSVNSKIRNFNNTPYEYGDYISVFAQDNENGVKIIGNIDKTLKIDEDYSDGIQNRDFMNNVRFRFDEEALEAVYNEAPKMTIPKETVEVYKGDVHDFVAGVKVSDDHDANLRPSDIIISKEDKDRFNKLGEHTITLILRDSWGRQVQGQRTFNVKTSIDRNKINFGGNITDIGDVRVNLQLGLELIEGKIKFKILKQLESGHKMSRWFNITLYNKNHQVKVDEIRLEALDTANEVEKKLKPLIDKDIEYGDYIKMNADQKFRYSIDGPVRDGLEDYSDGVQLGDDFMSTKFYITEAGLHAHYESPIVLNDNESLIEYIGTNGRIPLKMKFNHNNNSVTFLKGEGYFNFDANEDIVFKIKLHKKSDNSITEIAIRGRRMHNCAEVKQLKDTFANGFTNGDYLTFESYDSKKIRIRGKLIKGDGVDADEDFGDGIDKEYLMTQTRFYLNKTEANGTEEKGIKVVRLGAPTIVGADDIEIPQGSTFSAREDVRVIDFDNMDLTDQMEVTGENINTNRIGVNEIVYKVTNENNITDTVIRNVSVYSTAAITLIDNSSTPYIEQGTSEKDAKAYLKPLVQAQDTADNNNNLNEKVEVDISKVDLEVPGTYPVTYSVINAFDKESTLSVDITVGRKINVTVPTTLPFQVVTNLLDEKADPFISGVLKIQNNNTSEVDVSIKSFTKEEGSGELELVGPNDCNWEELSSQDSMKKMALGMYVKSGLTGKPTFVNESPLWLKPDNINNIPLGIMPRAESKTNPSECKLSFTSKHGKNFIGGTAKGKFKLVFEFK